MGVWMLASHSGCPGAAAGVIFLTLTIPTTEPHTLRWSPAHSTVRNGFPPIVTNCYMGKNGSLCDCGFSVW